MSRELCSLNLSYQIDIRALFEPDTIELNVRTTHTQQKSLSYKTHSARRCYLERATVTREEPQEVRTESLWADQRQMTSNARNLGCLAPISRSIASPSISR
eukprot:1654564-Pleurochrysis_carterae.AAC.2